MGPETFLLMFEQIFSNASVPYKQYMADQFTPFYNDVLNKLACSTDTCADLDARKAAIQAALDEMAPFLGSGGGGGGGS